MLKSTRWFERTDSPNWIVDKDGVLLGYLDDKGAAHYLPSQNLAGDVTDADEPQFAMVPIRRGPGAFEIVANGMSFSNVFIDVVPDDGSLDQTARVQAALNSCRPGQTAVLPPPLNDTKRFVRCSGITIPSGVSLESAGSSPIGWTLYFSRTLSQAYNSRIGRIWMKQCRARLYSTPETGTSSGGNSGAFLNDATKNWAPDTFKGCWVRIDSGTGVNQTKMVIGNTATRLLFNTPFTVAPDATSVYSVNSSISAIVFAGTQFDGTDPTGIVGSSGDCIELGQLAFDTKLYGVQIWNYGGWGMAAYGNPDKVNNSGEPFLATGVFITGDDLKIFNCGGGGEGGGIHLRGGPKDGGSLHLGKVLIDHCQQTLRVDDSMNGNPDLKPLNSGGWVVNIESLRNELCGKVGSGGAETPTITNIRGLINIGHIWHSSSVTTANYRNIHHRRGTLTIRSGRMVKGGSTCYGLYCDQGRTALCDWQANYDYDIGRLVTATSHVGASRGTFSAMRFLMVKAADGMTLQHLIEDGQGWGVGTGAGDLYSPAVSPKMTLGGAAVSVGNVFDKLYYEWKTGGSFRIFPDNRLAASVLGTSIHRQSTGVAGITVDMRLPPLVDNNRENGFLAFFYGPDGEELNLASNATMPIGASIMFSATLSLNALT